MESQLKIGISVGVACVVIAAIVVLILLLCRRKQKEKDQEVMLKYDKSRSAHHNGLPPKEVMHMSVPRNNGLHLPRVIATSATQTNDSLGHASFHSLPPYLKSKGGIVMHPDPYLPLTHPLMMYQNSVQDARMRGQFMDPYRQRSGSGSGGLAMVPFRGSNLPASNLQYSVDGQMRMPMAGAQGQKMPYFYPTMPPPGAGGYSSPTVERFMYEREAQGGNFSMRRYGPVTRAASDIGAPYYGRRGMPRSPDRPSSQQTPSSLRDPATQRNQITNKQRKKYKSNWDEQAKHLKPSRDQYPDDHYDKSYKDNQNKRKQFNFRDGDFVDEYETRGRYVKHSEDIDRHRSKGANDKGSHPTEHKYSHPDDHLYDHREDDYNEKRPDDRDNDRNQYNDARERSDSDPYKRHVDTAADRYKRYAGSDKYSHRDDNPKRRDDGDRYSPSHRDENYKDRYSPDADSKHQHYDESERLGEDNDAYSHDYQYAAVHLGPDDHSTRDSQDGRGDFSWDERNRGERPGDRPPTPPIAEPVYATVDKSKKTGRTQENPLYQGETPRDMGYDSAEALIQ